MAADKPNIVIMHIEKGVLGLCILFLLYSLVHWVAGSPREFAGPKKGTMVKPSDLDAEILKYAESVRDKNNSGTVALRTVPGYVAAIEKWIGNPPVILAGQVVEFQAPLLTPEYIPQIMIPERTSLAKVKAVCEAMKSTSPHVWLGGELPKITPLEDTITAHGAVYFPVDTLGVSWRELFRKTMLSQWTLAILGVEVEVKETLSDGTELPVRKVFRSPGSLATTMPVAEGAAPAGAAPAVGKAATPARPAPAATPATPVVAPAVPTQGQQAASLDTVAYDGTKRNLDALAKSWVASQQPELINPSYPEVWAEGKWITWKDLAKQPYNQSTSPDSVDVAVVPPNQTIVWFHDEKLKAGSRYSYRVRLVFLNPTFCCPDVLENEDDASVKEVFSGWSDWSKPEYVTFTTTFDLAGRSQQRSARIRVTREFLGQKPFAIFTVSAGQPIGGLVTQNVIDVSTGQEVSREVPYSTGAIVVEVDSEKKILRASDPTKLTGGGFEVLYLDDENRLRTFIDRPR